MFLVILERGEGKGRETSMWERSIDVRNIDLLLPIEILTGDQTHKPGVHPDRELYQEPFSAQDDAQLSHTG